MGTDISERLLTESKLKASEQRFRDLVSLSTDWYWEQDAEFRFTRFSGPALEKIGIDTRHLLGKTRWEIKRLGGATLSSGNPIARPCCHASPSMTSSTKSG